MVAASRNVLSATALVALAMLLLPNKKSLLVRAAEVEEVEVRSTLPRSKKEEYVC